MKIYIRADYYDEYQSIISRLKSAETYEDMKEIDRLIQNSQYAKDNKAGLDDSNNYTSLQISWLNRMKELGF